MELGVGAALDGPGVGGAGDAAAAAAAAIGRRFMSAAHTAATNVMIILGLTSTMSSHVRNTAAPSFRATDSANFALRSRRAGVSDPPAPADVRLGGTARGSTADSSWSKNALQE